MSTVELRARWPLRSPDPRRVLVWLSALLVLDLLWASVSVGWSLHTARDQLRRFARASSSGEGRDLGSSLQRAGAAAHSAQLALERHPSLDILRHLGLARTLEGASGLAEIAERAAAVGVGLLDELRSLSDNDLLISDGRLIESGLQGLRAEVQGARIDLNGLLADLERVEAAPLPWFDGQIAEVRDNLVAATDLADRIEELLVVLPALAGYDGERRYLLALQSPSEARGGGGLIGLYGVLEADQGRFRLGRFRSAWAFNEALQGSVDAPLWFRDLYGSLGATRDVRMVNLSPSFPTVARVLLNMHASATG
ncbi:MAG: DUF4012 domain-containing protein [Actinomycetota bacterium]